MTIRPCLPSDAAAIEALFLEFVEYLRGIGDTHVYRFGARQYLADGFGADPAFRGLVAEDAGHPEGGSASTVTGYVLFSKTYDSEYVRGLYIVDLYVRRGARGRGIGRQLVDAVRDLARREGASRVSWDVHRNNLAAVRFYEALGAQYASDTQVMYLDLD